MPTRAKVDPSLVAFGAVIVAMGGTVFSIRRWGTVVFAMTGSAVVVTVGFATLFFVMSSTVIDAFLGGFNLGEAGIFF